MKNIEDKIKVIISDFTEHNIDEITMETELNTDRIEFIEVVMAIEEKFDIDISDEDFYNIQTVREVIEYIKSHPETY